jgi:hypothetical protein
MARMPPATGPALIILVAFLLPGFVTVWLQENTYRRSEDPTALDRLLRILYYSVWTYLLLALAALILGIDRAYVEDLYKQNEGDPAELVWRGALLILVPSAIIATATRFWYRSKLQSWAIKRARINEHHLEPSAWDFFFRKRMGAYVRVTFKDGHQLLGFYGPDSFAAYAKDGRDLFLECVYAPDAEGWFGPKRVGSTGAWVDAREVVYIEFYTDRHEPTDPEAAGATPGPEAGAAGGTGSSAAQGAATGTPSAPTKERLKTWLTSRKRRT